MRVHVIGGKLEGRKKLSDFKTIIWVAVVMPVQPLAFGCAVTGNALLIIAFESARIGALSKIDLFANYRSGKL